MSVMEGMKLAAAGADAALSASGAWRQSALECVRAICDNYETFTTDEIWELLETLTTLPDCPEGRAMGGVVRTAAKNGWCKSTGQVVKSRRTGQHGSFLTVWQSRLCERD